MPGHHNDGAAVALVVDDDAGMRRMLRLVLEQGGFEVIAADGGVAALGTASTCAIDVVVLDFRMPDMNGIEVLQELKLRDPQLPVLLLTGFADIAGAVQAIKEGAFDYLAKPFDNRHLLNKVREAIACTPRGSARETTAEHDGVAALHARMGHSAAISHTIDELQRVAPTAFSVTISGETGAGKEVVARAIHDLSSRREGPFIAVDCGTIPENLIENELFGHERGAFTGADRQQPGRFEAATGGTLFLDEIGNLSWAAQARLLRVLQERVIYRVGGNRAIPIDVRLIAASNQDLTAAVAEKRFRDDLLYRLCEYHIELPALRERGEDVLHLARQFLAEANRELAKQVFGLTAGAAEALLHHPWPGNVRELRSVVRRAVLMAAHSVDVHHLDLPTPPAAAPRAASTGAVEHLMRAGLSLREIVRKRTADVERQVLFDALHQTAGNKAAVARLLKVDYKTVHTKLKAYGLSA